MTKTKIKYLVGVYACALCFMAMLTPVPIIASIVQAFPVENIVLIQMIVSMPSLIMAFAGMAVSSLLAHRFYKKHVALVSFVVFMLGGLAPLAFHGSVIELLVAAAVVGLGLGGLQNSSDALLADYFIDKERSTVMGLFSTFVGLGGVLWTVLAANLGAAEWTHAFLGYFLFIPLIVVAAICLPKGKLEPKRTTNVFANLPREVVMISVVGFVFLLAFQVFNANVSLLVVERSLGGTIEAGWATTATTIAGIVAGLLVGPLFAKFKNLAIPIMISVAAVGMVICLVAPGIWILCIGGFVLALAKEAYIPLAGNYAAGNSNPAGRAFSLAFGQAGVSLGMAFSPMVFGAAASPLGGTIDAKFMLGIGVLVLLAAFGFWKFRKLTAKQLREKELIEAAARGEIADAAEGIQSEFGGVCVDEQQPITA